ncbi:MAG: TolC family protein [Gemmatimonadaceae bacterium]|nr:TolC family protein [Gemmatimonadaceae bacterium]
MTRTLILSITATALLATAAVAQTPVTLTMGGAARMAVERTAGPEAARLRRDQAAQRVRQQKASFLPNVGAVASDGERTFNSASFGISFADPATGKSMFDPNGQVLGPVKTWDLRGSLQQSLLNPSAFARLRAAEASHDASAQQANSVAQQAAAAAAAAYVRAAHAEALLAALSADSSLAADLLGIARAQLDAGVGVALDVTRAQAQLSVTHSQLIAARAERDRNQISLARAAGLPLGTTIALADSLPAAAVTELPDATAAMRTASASRADLAAANAEALAAERSLQAARADALPALSLYVDQGVTGKATQHMLSTYTWGLQLSVPVFDGFRRTSRNDEARLAVRQADVQRRDLEEQVAADVSSALLDLKAASELLVASEERVSLAGQELSQARDRFSAGVTGNADVITAQLALNAARTQAIDARASLQLARVSLARAQGTITDLP